jgi:hypothetical protein
VPRKIAQHLLGVFPTVLVADKVFLPRESIASLVPNDRHLAVQVLLDQAFGEELKEVLTPKPIERGLENAKKDVGDRV